MHRLYTASSMCLQTLFRGSAKGQSDSTADHANNGHDDTEDGARDGDTNGDGDSKGGQEENAENNPLVQLLLGGTMQPRTPALHLKARRPHLLPRILLCIGPHPRPPCLRVRDCLPDGRMHAGGGVPVPRGAFDAPRHCGVAAEPWPAPQVRRPPSRGLQSRILHAWRARASRPARGSTMSSEEQHSGTQKRVHACVCVTSEPYPQ